MDNFIDKLAQKFIAGEVIKANSVAEEKELKRLREQVAEYEKCLQEMRKIQMINTQTAQNLHDLMAESVDSFQKLTKESTESFQKFVSESSETFRKHTGESAESFQKLTSESVAKIADIQLEGDVQKAEAKKAVEMATTTMEQMQEQTQKMQETVARLTQMLEKNQKEVEEWFKQADDYLHKENVKVYRNVQAVVVEELKKQNEELSAKLDAMSKTQRTTRNVAVSAMFFALLAAAALAAQLLIQFGIVSI